MKSISQILRQLFKISSSGLGPSQTGLRLWNRLKRCLTLSGSKEAYLAGNQLLKSYTVTRFLNAKSQTNKITKFKSQKNKVKKRVYIVNCAARALWTKTCLSITKKVRGISSYKKSLKNRELRSQRQTGSNGRSIASHRLPNWRMWHFKRLGSCEWGRYSTRYSPRHKIRSERNNPAAIPK